MNVSRPDLKEFVITSSGEQPLRHPRLAQAECMMNAHFAGLLTQILPHGAAGEKAVGWSVLRLPWSGSSSPGLRQKSPGVAGAVSEIWKG
jgi:hypothetical protein